MGAPDRWGTVNDLYIRYGLSVVMVACMSKFLESGDSRETSRELIEAIYIVARGDEAAAERIWADPTDAELISIYEMATKNGLLDPAELYWGAASNEWWPE